MGDEVHLPLFNLFFLTGLEREREDKDKGCTLYIVLYVLLLCLVFGRVIMQT